MKKAGLWKGALRRAGDSLPGVEYLRSKRDADALRAWESRGRSLPTPHAYKRCRVFQVAREHGCDTLIETGTLVGDMVRAALPHFNAIHSIELSPSLAAQCRLRFAGIRKVRIHEGDSGVLLPGLARDVHGDAVLWLDAHYSAGPTARGADDTPIVRELRGIAGTRHRILIDDAHLFVGRDGYPTVEELQVLTRELFPCARLSVVGNLLRIA